MLKHCWLFAPLLVLSGCTIGPKVKDRIVFVKAGGVAARVAKNLKAELIVEHDGQVYTETRDIGGFYIISPDLKEEKAPEKEK